MKTIAKRTGTFNTVIEANGDEPSITISTSTPDRDGDVVVPSGIDLTAYRKNPCVLFGHNSRELPVGATTRIEVTQTGVRAWWKWLEGDVVADRVRNAFQQGVLRSSSIGFRPLQYTPIEGGYRFEKVELLEWSLTPVPANSEAVKMLKVFGLAPDEDEPVLMIDDGDDDTILFDTDVLRQTLQESVRDARRQIVRAQVRHALESVVVRSSPSRPSLSEAERKKFLRHLAQTLPNSAVSGGYQP